MTHAPLSGAGPAARDVEAPPATDRRHAAVHSFALVAGWIAAAAGAMALAGWVSGIDILESVEAGHARMNPVTAICLIVAGIALWRAASRTRFRGPPIGGPLVALVGVLRLGDLAGVWRSHIDEFLFGEQLHTLSRGDTGRMSLPTAVAFLLLGAALVLLRGRRPRRITVAQALAVLIAVIAVTVLVGHAYNASALYTFSSSVTSLPTAGALLVLAAGIVCVDARSGLASPLASEGPGGRLVRHVLPPAILIPFVVGWLTLNAGRAGLVDTAGESAMLVAVSIALLAALLWAAALRLDALDLARERSEHAARESEAQYRRLLDTSPDGMWVHDRGRLLYANPASARLLGLRNASEAVGRSVLDFVPEESRALVADRIRRVADGWIPSAAFEHEFVRADGCRIALELFALPITYHGTPAIQATFRDVTARRAAERKLAASEARFRALLESAPDALVIVDTEDDIVLVNRSAERLFGWTRAELAGRRVDELLPRDARAALDGHRPWIAAIRAGVEEGGELRATRRDGDRFPVEVTLSPIDTADGPLVIASIRDISHRVRIEADLRRVNAQLAQALAEIDRLKEPL